jgi:hypothetical protein
MQKAVLECVDGSVYLSLPSISNQTCIITFINKYEQPKKKKKKKGKKEENNTTNMNICFTTM